MNLYETIGSDLKEAMKSGDTLKRDTLRLLQSAIKNMAIEKRKPSAECSDAEVEDVLRRLVKQRKDSIEQYRAGGRVDLAEKEASELRLLEAYLPQAMPESELATLVKTTLAESGMTTKTQMGQAMGVVMKRVAGRASGDDVRKMVERFLS